MTNEECIVTTTKSVMRIYAFLYIIGLIGVVIGAILEFFTIPNALVLSIIFATILFTIATIIWAIDRKCQPLSQLLTQK